MSLDDKDIAVIYPTNISKYYGRITEHKQKKGSVFVVTTNKNKQGKQLYKTFDTYELAFRFIRDYNIKHNLVKNVVYDYGDHLRVSLSKGQVMLFDHVDLPLVNRHVICAMLHPRHTTYSARTRIRENKRNRAVGFHNLIMDHIPADSTVDHINKIPLDNRRSNLRIASLTIQGINRKAPKNNTSGTVGVSFQKARKHWVAGWSENMKYYVKHFRCDVLGYDEAKRQAIEYRKNKERTLPSYREALLL